jgi:hypothetical protein
MRRKGGVNFSLTNEVGSANTRLTLQTDWSRAASLSLTSPPSHVFAALQSGVQSPDGNRRYKWRLLVAQRLEFDQAVRKHERRASNIICMCKWWLVLDFPTPRLAKGL